ncbi:hypothetical protein DSO57_1031166 [Entomophthora muscae]|uniref:Uncharacterized protein n=1 Tax=Entomophthora muscae TaxID=34485 RepID=A0ACC2RFK5_9FUNG|nr:hypothetical protein DSO57_1031166 [Entomophthora muscae]
MPSTNNITNSGFGEVRVYNQANKDNQALLACQVEDLTHQLNNCLTQVVESILKNCGLGPVWAQDVTCHVIAIKQYVVNANSTKGILDNLLVKYGASLELHGNLLCDLREKISNNKEKIIDMLWCPACNIDNAAKSEVLALWDDFAQYNDHIKNAIREESSQLRQKAYLNSLISQPATHPIGSTTVLILTELHKFGILDKFELPSKEEILPTVCTIIPREQLQGLPVAQQDAALALFEKYKEIFSKDNFNLGCTRSTLHHIDTGEERPIHLCPIKRSCASDTAVDAKIEKLV